MILTHTVHTAHAVSNAVIYETDFSQDPAWITDQPENFYWDESQAVLFARTYNRPDPSHSPSRHSYIETTLNPKLSYELTWDMQIVKVEGGGTAGVATFGLYGDRLHGFNPLNIIFQGNDQDGTFSLRLMTIDGLSRFIFTEVNPGYNYDIGEFEERRFSLGVWYRITERYNALTREYSFEMRDRNTGNVVYTHSIFASFDEVVNPELQNLGISMHPEGTGATNLAYGARIEGFTEYLIDNVILTQIYDETYTEPSSVLFLPGIQASRLYTDGTLGTENQLWEPNINSDVAKLEMTDAGASVLEIYTRDIVDSVHGYNDVYGTFTEYLETLKTSGVVSDWETFAYDWRYSVDDVVQNGTRYEEAQRNLIDQVETLAKENNSRVTVIGHSNGGLLAKALIQRLETEGKSHLVDRLILVASPQVGTPKAVGAILHGYDQERLGGLVVDDVTARDVMKNFPGAYGLVPSESFFTSISEPMIRFGVGATTMPFINAYGTTIDTPDELARFIVGEDDARSNAVTPNEVEKGNSIMLEDAYTLHRDVLDDWTAPPYIQVIEIVGTGLDTAKGFEYKEFVKRTCVHVAGSDEVVCIEEPYYEPVPIFTQYGDETVVTHSAEAYGGDKLTYYVDLEEVSMVSPQDKVTHADITALAPLQDFIGGLLNNQSTLQPFVSISRPEYNTEREVISVHSPVTLTLTDLYGNYVGRQGAGVEEQVVTDIPGSSYFEIGGATYIVVPKSTSYTATVEGIGEEGSYTLVTESLIGENPPTTIFTTVATATPSLEATFSKSMGVYSELSSDFEGDGNVDIVENVAPEPTVGELFNALRGFTNSFTKLKVKDRTWLLNSINKAASTGVTKGYSSSAVQRIFAQIDSKLIQHVSAGKVGSSEYNMFMSIVNEIKTR